MNATLERLPWHHEGESFYTDEMLQRFAEDAARSLVGRLIDWRLIVDGGELFLQTRVLVQSYNRYGREYRYHNTAL